RAPPDLSRPTVGLYRVWKLKLCQPEPKPGGAPRRLPPRGPVRALDLVLGLEDLPAAVLAGLEIDMVGPPPLTTFLVLDVGRRLQRVGGPAEAALHRRHLLAGYSHA